MLTNRAGKFETILYKQAEAETTATLSVSRIWHEIKVVLPMTDHDTFISPMIHVLYSTKSIRNQG